MSVKEINVDLGERSYKVHVGSGILEDAASFIPFSLEGKRAFLVADNNTKAYADKVSDALVSAGIACIDPYTLKPGEANKSFSVFQEITEWMLGNDAARDSVIVPVGGGVIGDVVGFVASTLKRGAQLVQVPTSLQAQVDSSVGGKNAINTQHGKNQIGTIYQPKAVVIDTDTLATLPERELRSGYAEILKYALIKDASFFTWLDENATKVLALQQDELARAIDISVKGKAKIVQADETEQGQRALLNLGHTFGHGLETIAARAGGTLLHGEAVAIGMVMAFDLSQRMELCPKEDFLALIRHLRLVNLPTSAGIVHPSLNIITDQVIDLMSKDKKVERGKIRLVLPSRIGDAFITSDIDKDLLRAVIENSLGVCAPKPEFNLHL